MPAFLRGRGLGSVPRVPPAGLTHRGAARPALRALPQALGGLPHPRPFLGKQSFPLPPHPPSGPPV